MSILLKMIHKQHLWLFVFFILVGVFVSADDDVTTTTTESVPTTTDYPPFPREDFVELIPQWNNLRREFAKNHTIANMYELVWDEKAADLVDADSSDHYDDYQHNANTDIEEFLSHAKYKGDQLTSKNLNIDDIKSLMYDYLSLLYPLFTHVGCGTYHYNGRRWAQCYFSPVFFEVSGYETTGEPGSKCPDGYGNNDGLCSVIGSFTPPTTTPDPTTEAPTTPAPSTTPAPTNTPDPTTKAPEVPSPKPTQRPAPIPEKQTSDEKAKESGESGDPGEPENVAEPEESGSSALVSSYSICVCILLVQLWTLF